MNLLIPPAMPDRRITGYAFHRRFSTEEAIAIDLASFGETVEAAALRRYQKMIDLAQFVNLDEPYVREGVEALAVMGLIAPERVAEIMDAPVTVDELP